jgi:sterol desaturase/sphingolipid hydroxylase (fatty acid hydroxylase superfamily)
MGQRIFARAFVPGLLLLSIASWIWHTETEAYLRQARWGIDHTTAALLLSIALVALAEQLFPAHPEWNYNVAANPARGLQRFGRDLFYLSFVALASGFLVGCSARWLGGLGLPVLPLWPRAAPLPAKVALAFFTVEFLSYWYHRAAHRFEFLWRFHSTHHVSGELTGVKALRTHPVDNVLFYFVRSAPLVVLGAESAELQAVTYLGSILGILAHANIAVVPGALGWVVNFPQYHGVHHSLDLQQSQSNYGCHTVLWDRLFWTFRSQRQGELRLGIAPAGPRSLWQELGWPFYRSVRLPEVPGPDRAALG